MNGAVSDHWKGRLAVTGLGLVTPVGLYAEATTAALRAGVSRLSSLTGFRIQVGENEVADLTGAEVPRLTEGLQGPARLKKMFAPALAECIEDAGLGPDQSLGVFLGTSGSSPAERVLSYEEAHKEMLLDSLPEGITVRHAKLIQSGRAAVERAIRFAAAALADGRIEVAIIGAADSWVTTRALNWLRHNQKLPEYPRHTGNIPGEAAGFLALETPEHAARRSVHVYAEIVASAGSQEAVKWGEAHNGLALARALRAAGEGVSEPHAVVISDLDSERYRALEWVMAEPKGMWDYRTLDHWNPADCVGDSGAAMGAVMLAWASSALDKDYAGAPGVLVWGASDEGAREAVMLRRARGSG